MSHHYFPPPRPQTGPPTHPAERPGLQSQRGAAPPHSRVFLTECGTDISMHWQEEAVDFHPERGRSGGKRDLWGGVTGLVHKVETTCLQDADPAALWLSWAWSWGPAKSFQSLPVSLALSCPVQNVLESQSHLLKEKVTVSPCWPAVLSVLIDLTQTPSQEPG